MYYIIMTFCYVDAIHCFDGNFVIESDILFKNPEFEY